MLNLYTTAFCCTEFTRANTTICLSSLYFKTFCTRMSLLKLFLGKVDLSMIHYCIQRPGSHGGSAPLWKINFRFSRPQTCLCANKVISEGMITILNTSRLNETRYLPVQGLIPIRGKISIHWTHTHS